ncbi:MAG: AAA family ATPase, partial [Christensenellales bacterium]
MDKGAHFYCCDFQIHTPRDPQWKGIGALTEDERKEYAESFVAACRNRGVQAVAITDHHDFTFFPYIKKAAEDELTEGGLQVEKEKQLIVFPGMELTLGKPPCQALLILNADFPPEQLSTIIAKLSINQNPSIDEKNKCPVEKISHTNDLKHLYDELDSLSYVKGQYIVLPNVSDGGSHTLLRSGFENYYKTMPCVGGYVDGAITKLGTGNQNILAGKSQAHGHKSIAVLQTSDMRTRDFATLGQFCTWVKWSEPTAEAIRQACLACESRLDINAPKLPVAWIESISVSNSKFMGPIEIAFNPQYNALIGGRGTGKSTILEYIRWALCDQQNHDEAELSSVQSRRQSLIEKTLKDFNSD